MPKKQTKENKCYHRDTLLNQCTDGIFNGDLCHYVEHPEQCFGYEDAETKAFYTPTPPVSTPSSSTDLLTPKDQNPDVKSPLKLKTGPGDTEDLYDFSTRMDAELRNMGIKVISEPPYPVNACASCGTRRYWLSYDNGPATWVCQTCHPKFGTPDAPQVYFKPDGVKTVSTWQQTEKAPDWF
jgi:hypothetical protein